ncbi:hypothetical protein AVEN_170554-1, partial [Araneus ventricosus]
TVASLPDSGSQSSRSQRTSIGSEILMYVPNYEVPNSPAPSREADCLNVNLGNLKVSYPRPLHVTQMRSLPGISIPYTVYSSPPPPCLENSSHRFLRSQSKWRGLMDWSNLRSVQCS